MLSDLSRNLNIYTNCSKTPQYQIQMKARQRFSSSTCGQTDRHGEVNRRTSVANGNRKELPQQWKESVIIVTIYGKETKLCHIHTFYPLCM